MFSHYASHALTPNRRVVAISRTLDDTSYNEISIVLRPALLRAVLGLARDGISIEKLTGAADAPGEHTAYATAWLLKYGLLRLDERPPGAMNSRSQGLDRLPA